VPPNADLTDFQGVIGSLCEPPIETREFFVGHRVSFSRTVLLEGSSLMKSLFTRFASDESGATAIEYGMIAALIAVAIIAALKTVGNNLGTKFNQISGNLG